MKICFASHNANKVKELNGILPDSISLIGLDDLGISEDIAETGNTLEENSRIKAKYIHERHQIPVIADDSGLLVNVLNGEPGVYSARYAGPERSENKNMDLLMERLSGKSDRTAEFQTVITFIDHANKEWQFKGILEGSIAEEKRGDNGFGYDPIFIPNGYNQTFAELSNEEKNHISHRSLAVRKFLKHFVNTHV